MIQKENPAGEIYDFARFVTGEAFGEIELFRTQTSRFRAVAYSNCKLLQFPKSNLSVVDVEQRNPYLFSKILHELIAVVAGRIRSTNKLISDNSRWVQELRRQIFKDKITGLYNASYLSDNEYKHIFGDKAVAMLMIKPDNFKMINDTYGHEAGDNSLRLFAATLLGLVEEPAIALRYRGNEFAVIVPGSNKQTIAPVARRIFDTMCAIDISNFIDGRKMEIPFSLGIAVWPEDTTIPEELPTIANETLYRARNAGGKRIVVFGDT